MAAWGDSMTNGAGSSTNNSFIAQLGRMTGYAVFNGGKDGGNSDDIKTRMLADASKHSYPTIIWSGNNDALTAEGRQVAFDNIAEMVAALGHDRYLIIGQINGANSYGHIGNAGYTVIVNANAALEAEYGERFIDIREHMVSLYNPLDAQDVIDHANDTVPSSLRSDAIHFNDAGYRAVAEKVYEKRHLLGVP